MLSITNASWISLSHTKIGFPYSSLPAEGGSLTIKYTIPVWSRNKIEKIMIMINDLDGVGKENLRYLIFGKLIFGFLSFFPKIHGKFLLIFSIMVSEPIFSGFSFLFVDFFCLRNTLAWSFCNLSRGLELLNNPFRPFYLNSPILNLNNILLMVRKRIWN